MLTESQGLPGVVARILGKVMLGMTVERGLLDDTSNSETSRR